MNDPVPAHIPANLLLAADSMLRDGHVEAATHLLIRAEALIARVADPQNFASLMNHADRLWKSKLIATGLRPKGISSVPPPQPPEGVS